MMTKQNTLTNGSILQAFIRLSWPIFLANLLQTAYQLVDTFWVGRLGASAMAAVSLSFPLLFLLSSFIGGLASAGTILVAQYFGKKDRAMVNHLAGQTIGFITVLSLIISTGGYLASQWLVIKIGASPEVAPLATTYLQISFIGLTASFFYTIYQSLMRGIGQVKIPMYLILASVILNCILDPLFIYGVGPLPAMGVAGAAWATILTEFLAALACLILIFQPRFGLHINGRHLWPDWQQIRRICQLGWPSSLEQSSRSLSMLLLTGLAASFGTTVVAAYGLGLRILSLAIIPAVSLSMANATLVGHNIGAQEYQRARKTSNLGLKLAFFSLSAFGLVLIALAPQIGHFFLPRDPEAVAMSSQFIRWISISLGLFGWQMIIMGSLRGAGKTRTTMILAVVNIVILISIAYGLANGLGWQEKGLWLAFPITNLITTIISSIWFWSTKWYYHNLTIQPKQIATEEALPIGESFP